MDANSVELSLVTPPTSSTSKEPTTNNDEKDSAGSSRSGCTSPDPNCAICLGKLDNKCFTDSCFHQFCYGCLVEWSKVKPECPLCKQRFQSIIHNVRSMEDFDQYFVRSADESLSEGIYGVIAAHIGHIDLRTPRQPFRYRTTVSRYLDYFVRLEEAINNHVIPGIPASTAENWRRRRCNGTSDFRRNIYQQGLWVQRSDNFTGRIRECTPEFYRCNPAQVHRLVPWLNRELNVLCNRNYHQVQRAITRILELIIEIPIRSPAFSVGIAPFFGRHTEHFIHEFHSYATSAYDLIGYDRNVSYVGRDSIANEDTDFSPLRNDDESDSDVQILEPSSTITSIQLDSDSDECVVVDSVPPRQPSPEVITLESDPDDDVVQVNIHIESDINQPGPSKRPTLKRNWLTVKNVQVPKSNNDNLNVSINIAHARRSRSSSTDTSSSSSWTPCNKKSAKKICKKEQCKKAKIVKSKSKSKKGAKVKEAHKNNKGKQTSSSSYARPLLSSSEDDRSKSPVIAPRRRGSAAALKTSDDDDNCALHIVTESKSSGSMIVPQRRESTVSFKASDDESRGLHIVTNEDSCSSPDEFKQKPRLRSVVVKSNIKSEHQDDSSDHLIRPWEYYNKSYKTHKYSCRNTMKMDEEYSDWSWSQPSTSRRRSFSSSSSEDLPLCKRKCSKKKMKRERI